MTEPSRELIAWAGFPPAAEDVPEVIQALLSHLNLQAVRTNDTPQGRKHGILEVVIEPDI